MSRARSEAAKADAARSAMLKRIMDEAQVAYGAAIAAQINGEDASALWDRFGAITGIAMIAGWVQGADGASAIAEAAGLKRDHRKAAHARSASLLKALLNTIDPRKGFTLTLKPAREALAAHTKRVPIATTALWGLLQRAMTAGKQVADQERTMGVDHIMRRSPEVRSVIDGSFWASGVGEGGAEEIKNLLTESMQSGYKSRLVRKRLKLIRQSDKITLPEFIDESLIRTGANLTRARVETIYRVAVNKAYNRGHLDVVTRPQVQAIIPLVEINEIHDRRTRGAPGTNNPGFHWQMDGYINTASYVRGNALTPPCGYNCRGSLIGVTLPRAERLGLVDSHGQPVAQAITAHNGVRQRIVDRGDYPDKGWLG